MSIYANIYNSTRVISKFFYFISLCSCLAPVVPYYPIAIFNKSKAWILIDRINIFTV